MARGPARDVRQGDLFGAPLPPPKFTPRAVAPKKVAEDAPARKTVTLEILGQKATRVEIGELLDSLPDEELAYLAVEATRVVKRRLARGQGRRPRLKPAGRGKAPLDDALHRIGGELMEFEDPGETW
jgi:hypothetical protein